MHEITRRGFLKIAAGAGAMAVDVASKEYDHLLSYVVPPEQTRPGVWATLATTCRECPAGCGMHLRHRDGRVVKAEGNPDHPVNYGGLCPRGQSAVQGLYDNDRIRRPFRRSGAQVQLVDWSLAIEQIAQKLAAAGDKVAMLSDLQTGSLAELMRGLLSAAGSQRLVFYEPFNHEPLREAHRAVFGAAVIPDYRLEACDLVVSFAADFLESWVSDVRFAHQFGLTRTYRDGRIGRFAYVGPRLSMTAANADDFLHTPPGGELAVALAMLQAVVRNGWARANVAPLRPMVEALGAIELPPGVSAALVAELAEQFAGCQASVALAGAAAGRGPVAYQTAVAAALLNYAAGRIGQTVDFSRPHALSAAAGSGQMRQWLEGLGEQDVLVIHQSNPVYSLPGSGSRIRRAGTVIYLGTMEDETAKLADWVLPIDSPLESWGDYEPFPGIHCLMQPTMGRIFDSRPAGDVLLDLAAAIGKPLMERSAEQQKDNIAPSFHDSLALRWRPLHQRLAGSQEFGEFWRDALRSGGAWEQPPAVSVRLEGTIAEFRFASLPAWQPAAADSADLWAWPSILLFDGRVANRGWLQEAPEPMSYISWGSWVDLHPSKAAALGVSDGDVVEMRGPAGAVEAPVRITEDVHPRVAAICLGQGHAALGRNAAGRGANAFALLTDRPEKPFPALKLRKTGRSAPPVCTSPTQRQFDRRIIQWARLSEVRRMKPGEGDKLILPLPEGYRADKDLYPPRQYDYHRWAMVIDLERCTGCGACAVACYAENNIPVMGAEPLRQGREMAWLKVVPYRSQEDSRRVGFLPMLCQHCDAAPCEPVCPVFAAVHNEEGLNAQVYNRCIGTRYCSNNCPYKVRRFNWLNVDWPKPLDWQLNPEVTVRCRGVMEKCTFCIQRIRQAEHQAGLERRRVRDGEIQPACAQSCPTKAFTFGDLIDPDSQVNLLTRNDPRRYHVLEELNTKPAVTYLRRILRDAKT